MKWTALINRKVEKALRKLPGRAQDALFALVRDIEENGPVQGKWPNYSKLSDNRHHCHIKKGNPTWVAVWEVTNKTIRLVEVIYVGTHEKAPY